MYSLLRSVYGTGRIRSRKNMAETPILIIQMQRLGDMVLSYPLMGQLSRLHAGIPLWVVGEEKFFSELIEFSPNATYFSYAASPGLRRHCFRSVINISHRPEAAALAGSLDTEELVGPYLDNTTGAMHIKGGWQLYRASLVNNNRYNLFHWADMNLLDSVPRGNLRNTVWPAPRMTEPTTSARIGLFLGASEPDKHPDAAFWAALAGELLAAGHRPVFLGGEAEKKLGAEAAKALSAPALNLAGHFSLSALSRFLSELDLFVTPDTGPMHLAAWTGTPVLNLSTGPVNAWETGPFPPGHYVLRAALPCVGCWHCTRSSVQCKKALHPKRTAFLIHELVSKKEINLHRLALPGQDLLRTAREPHGLYDLRLLVGEEQPRQVTALFWHAFFGNRMGLFTDAHLAGAWQQFDDTSPGNANAFARSLITLGKDLSLHLRGKRDAHVTSDSFWAAFPLPLRPLTSYLHLLLQNGMFRKPAFAEALSLVERLTALLAGA